MRNIVDQYKVCAAKTIAVDYLSRSSVLKNNRAVDRMYQIVRTAEQDGRIGELLPLLEDAQTAPWLAHQLVELATIDDTVRARCISIVVQLATGVDPSPGVLPYGEKLWLEKWCKHGD